MMSAGLRRVLWFASVLWIAPALAQTVPYTASVRWQPSTSAGVIGYRVYTRTLGTTYGAPLDAGMPTPAADGTMSFLVGGLDPSVGYAFSATAYESDGSESALSNELTLPAPTTTTTSTSSSTTTRPPTTSTTSTTVTSTTPTTSSTTTTARPTTTTTSSTTTTRPPTTSTTSTPVTSSTATTSSTTTTTAPPTTTTTTTTLACTSASQCNDNNPCTTDTCSAGVCQHTAVANGTSCDDGNVCNGAKACQLGLCVAGIPPSCDDGNPCTVDSCNPATGCTHVAVPDGTSCEDGLFCNGAETCRAGVCMAAPAPACDDGKACTIDSCNETLKRCVHQTDGCTCVTDADCASADVCNIYHCAAGRCASSPIVCPAGACTQPTCDPITGCGTMNLPDGTACDDGNPCTTGESCSAGVCRIPQADVVSGSPDVKLSIRKFVLRPHGRSGLRLMAKASFVPTMVVEPDRTGMAIEVDDARGSPLYAASVPADQFASNYARTQFLFIAAGRSPPAYAGLKVLQVRTGGRAVVVTAKAIVPASLLSAPAPVGQFASTVIGDRAASASLKWTLRFGGGCASNPVLCSTARRNKTCQPM